MFSHIDISILNILKKTIVLLIYLLCLFFVNYPTFAQEILIPEGNPQMARVTVLDSGMDNTLSAFGSCSKRRFG